MKKKYIKGNRLIAAYMGYMEITTKLGIMYDIKIPNEVGFYYKDEGLKFHCSWDWLMPVLARCIEGSDNNFMYEAWDVYLADWKFDNALYGNDIDFVYKRVVKYIKRYNKVKERVNKK